VDYYKEIAENFFKLCKSVSILCETLEIMWITPWISIGKILEKKNLMGRVFYFYIRPPDSKG